MKTAFILAFILLLLSFHSNAQQTIDKLNVNQLKLPKESSNKALILDGAGQVKSSSTISDTELGYLEGLSDTLVNLLSGKANDSDVVKLTGNQSVDGVKTFTGKLVASSTVNGSIPCPVMTEAQRDLFTPVEGDCVYNSDTLKLNVFDGSVWKDVGGAGGISLWLTANPYNVNDIVIESDKIYRCLIAHTSGTFATDLGSGNWVEVSQGLTSPVALADGGTGLSITPVAGSIVYVDADSFEQLAPGSPGQILQSNGSSAPSWVDKTEYVSPNNLETPVSSTQVLLESGNKNILTNPSFENTTFDSGGWVNSAGSFTENFANKVDGAKSARLVLSSQTMSLTQSSVLYQSSFADGVQGLASVWVKSDVALKVCAVQAGVVSTSLCVDVQANNKWGLYKVPFILGATSNGISIASTGNVTGTVYIDDAFVGAASLTQNMNACNDPSCETEFSAKISSTGVVSDENLDWISSGTGGAGGYTITFNTGLFSVAPNCVITPNYNAVNDGNAVITAISSASVSYELVQNATNTAQPAILKCQKQGADFTAAKQLSNGNTYSSTNADTDWASCGLTGSSFTGFGSSVPTPDIQCKRSGSDLLMKGKFTAGTTPTAVEARMSLPSWNGSQLVSAGSSIIPNIQAAGVGGRSDSPAGIGVLIEPSVSYVTFSQYADAVRPFLTKQNGSTIAASGTVFSFNARIPIEGWQNSNILIGQFNGLESCSSTLDCTDTFSAKISAAAVTTSENVDWINGNCTNVSTGVYTCNFNTSIFTVPPVCTGSFESAPFNSIGVDVYSVSSSSFSVRVNENGAAASRAFQVMCQKQGVDYVGKTAKAVASDQNLRIPGATNSVTYVEEVECDSSSSLVRSLSGSSIFQSIGNISSGDCSFTLKSGIFSGEPYCTTTYIASSGTSVTFSPVFTTATTGTISCRSGTAVCSGGGPFNISCTGISP